MASEKPSLCHILCKLPPYGLTLQVQPLGVTSGAVEAVAVVSGQLITQSPTFFRHGAECSEITPAHTQRFGRAPRTFSKPYETSLHQDTHHAYLTGAQVITLLAILRVLRMMQSPQATDHQELLACCTSRRKYGELMESSFFHDQSYAFVQSHCSTYVLRYVRMSAYFRLSP